MSQTFEKKLDDILAKHNGELGVTWEDPDVVTPDTLQAIISLIEEEVNKARYRELVDLGTKYNGKRSVYLDHYEERYKYLKGRIGE